MHVANVLSFCRRARTQQSQSLRITEVSLSNASTPDIIQEGNIKAMSKALCLFLLELFQLVEIDISHHPPIPSLMFCIG